MLQEVFGVFTVLCVPCLFYLPIELKLGGVSLDEVVQRPLDTVQHVVQLAGGLVRISVLQ